MKVTPAPRLQGFAGWTLDLRLKTLFWMGRVECPNPRIHCLWNSTNQFQQIGENCSFKSFDCRCHYLHNILMENAKVNTTAQSSISVLASQIVITISVEKLTKSLSPEPFCTRACKMIWFSILFNIHFSAPNNTVQRFDGCQECTAVDNCESFLIDSSLVSWWNIKTPTFLLMWTKKISEI